ncbi:MAG: hypothetical protein U1F11_06120 [Steroidobacteraceae bacterium]
MSTATAPDARAFLQNGGERGPQMTVILPGTYRANPLFTITLADAPDCAARQGRRGRGARRPPPPAGR